MTRLWMIVLRILKECLLMYNSIERNIMKIQFRAGKLPDIIYFLPYIRICRGERATDWKRSVIEIGFLCWAIGWLFASRPYCYECGAYFKDDCSCDDDWLDLDDDED